MTYVSISWEALAKRLDTQTHKRIDERLIALDGSLSEHQRDFLCMIFERMEALNSTAISWRILSTKTADGKSDSM